MPGLRVVLDTNVLVSGLAYPASTPGKILQAWREGKFDVVLSRYILDELVRVLPKLARVSLNADEVRDLADSFIFADGIVLVGDAEPDSRPDEELRDAADQPILAALRLSRADCLVTGDKDLLALSGRYPILTPADFWQRHGA